MNSTAIDQIRQGAQASELQSHTCIGKPRGVMLGAEMPEHCAQRLLAHANLSMISRYLKTAFTGMHEVLRRVEEHRIRCTHVAHGGSLAMASWAVSPSAASKKPLLFRYSPARTQLGKAPSPSGKAEVCKTSIPGSNPGGASNFY